MKTVCGLCPHLCSLEEGQTGLCRARVNQNGKVTAANYGRLTAISLDPVEKKPLHRFFPGRYILSVGSFGCNLHCPFCQNSDISMRGADIDTVQTTPEQLVNKAKELITEGNIGIAYTYNEPLVGYEFVYDCAHLAALKGLKNVLVTNGCFNLEPMKELFPLIDAMNIDLKCFTQQFYKKLGGDLDTVKAFICEAVKYSHVELTTLIIPRENDSEEEMRAAAEWIAGLSAEIPLHISRFFPCYKMNDREPTPVETIFRLAEVAREKLEYVYEGNV